MAKQKQRVFSANRVVIHEDSFRALLLRISGITYNQIGLVMGCSEAAAQYRVRKAQNQIIKARNNEARLAKD